MPTALERQQARAEAWLETIDKPRTKAASPLVVALRRALSAGQAGHWANDHREETNHYVGWNYVAIRALAMQAAQCDTFVFRGLDVPQKMQLKSIGARNFIKRFGKSSGGTRPLVKFHKSYGGDEAPGELLPGWDRLPQLLSRPNPTQSGAMARFEEIQQLQLTGTCLIWKVPNKLGLTVERYVIPTAITSPLMPSNEYPAGAYRISPTNVFQAFDDGFVDLPGYTGATGATIDARQMLIKRWPHPLYKSDGYSPIAGGALWTDEAEQVDQARWAQMKNGVDPSIAIGLGEEYDPDEEELDRIAQKIDQKYGGAGNKGKALIVPHGATFEALSTTPTEMAYCQAHDQLMKAIMGLHGTPPIAAGIEQGGSYAAFYAALLQYTRLTVQPTLSMMADEETEAQAPEFGDDLTVVYEAQAIDDPSMVEEQLKTDVTAGAIEVNEIRAIRGRDPKPYGNVPATKVQTENKNEVDDETHGAKKPGDEQATGFAGVERPAMPGGKRFRAAAVNGSNGHANGHVKRPWEWL